MKRLKWIAIAAALAIVGIAENEILKAQQRQYCENVRAGIWPDYAKSYKAECESKKKLKP